MNIAVKIVCQVGSVFSVGIPFAAKSPLLHRTSGWPEPSAEALRRRFGEFTKRHPE